MNDRPHLLVVDDDREIRDLVSRLLQKHGYKVETARDAQAMEAILAVSRIDLLILDIMLPGKSGLDICRELRARSSVPILMLTAVGEETDRIVGLEMGADDYLAKPFNPRELLARIRAILRRVSTAASALGPRPAATKKLRFAGWQLDLGRRRLEAPDGVIVDLTTGEYELLMAFAERPQRVLSRNQLLDLARGRDATPFDRSIDVQVSRIRRKIEADPRSPSMIITVRGDGYMFTPDVEPV
ncbi:MAG TPA: response regulator [Stellaceae bacterium]|nr:response regulator [Bauldia sp.]HWB51091.1 response regulator [Stellaceae bacterium]